MTPDIIAETLRREITAGNIGPGADLIQTELAERFAVSRIPVRDALQRLAVTGLVTVTPNRGARVIQLTADEIREVFELRVLLECDCLERAVNRMTPEFLADIEHVLRKSSLDADTVAWADGDWAFHAALYAPSGRRRQVGLIGDLRRTCQVHIAAYRRLPAEAPKWLDDHRRLVDLCRHGDAEAAADVLAGHIRTAGEILVEAMVD